ncbi:MAG: hypothetical protein HYW25_00535 [Candidatus Aenigmarchaeota archaeon]|nr:hypothetical protein [Candidatus Aenigmarchaeota archaeon]
MHSPKKFRRAFVFSLLVVLFFIPPSHALTASASGECRDFLVHVEHEGEGCFDVKIEAPAEVLHRDGWKDSFFYVPNALCSGEAVVRVRMLDTDNAVASVKLRRNNTVLQAPLEIVQNCSVVPDDVFLPVVFIVAAILLSLVWWEMRRK